MFSIENIKSPNTTTMRLEMLDSLSVLMVEADLLRKLTLMTQSRTLPDINQEKTTLRCKWMFSLMKMKMKMCEF